jgi:alpha-1,6-mannosyltransferase
MVFCDIASFYSPRGGGVATYHNQKLDYFARHPDHRYVMIAPAARDSVEQVPGGTIYRLRGFRFDANYRHIYDPVPLRRVLERVRPDVLEFGSPYLDFWAGRLAARRLGAHQTAYYHVDFPDTYVRPLLRGRLAPAEGPVVGLLYRYVRRVFGRLDATLAASRYVLEKLRRIGIANVVFLPLGVDAAMFRPSRRSDAFRRGLGIGPSDRLLLFAGRYRADKGVDTLLSALSRILADPRIHVALAGTGPLENQVRRWALRHGRVHDLGFIGDKALLAQTYASADGFVSPGGRETFGFGICEAVASGVPVVSADSGAGAEMVLRLGSGLLFKAGDPDDLVRAAQALVHTDLRTGVAAARETVVAGYNWDRVFDTYVDYHGSLR